MGLLGNLFGNKNPLPALPIIDILNPTTPTPTPSLPVLSDVLATVPLQIIDPVLNPLLDALNGALPDQLLVIDGKVFPVKPNGDRGPALDIDLSALGIDPALLTAGISILNGDDLANIQIGVPDLLNIIIGGDGDDDSTGGNGGDTMNGGSGHDTMGGGNGDDVMTGDDGNDVVSGGAGNDVISGGAGKDTLSGGDGNDILSGGDGDDQLNGGAGDDYLDGGTGADIMIGGPGNDVFVVDNPGDRVFESPNEGTDTVYSSINFTLSDHVENLVLTGASTIGQGNGLNNLIYGNDQINRITGFAGKDTLHGGAGNDTLIGGPGNDVLFGEAGRDRLIGGTGADKLYGGAGKDTFVFTAIKDSTASSKGRDKILDFQHKEKDKVDLIAIDANSKTSGNEMFKFIGSQNFHDQAGELRYARVKGGSVVYGDTNGDGAADFSVFLKGISKLVSSDFLL